MGGGSSKAPEGGNYGVEIGSFAGKYVGSVSVSSPTGAEICQEAVKRTLGLKQQEKPVTIRITTVGIFLIDSKSGDVLKEVATANISFVSMDPSSSQLISFFENDEEIRLIACHTFRIPKDAHQLPLCINTSFKILTGQIEAPKEEDKAQLQRRMSKVGKKEALAESKAMPHILKGELVETFKCQYVGSVGVGQPKGDDVVTEALTRITKLNDAHKVQPSDAEIRIYENVFSIVQLSAGEEVAVAHIRDVTFAKLSADSKQFSAILFDKRGQTYECHSTLVEPLEEGRPSIRRTIDTVQKKNIAMAKEAAASEEKKAEENKKDEEEAQTGKILGVFEALLLGVEIVPQPKGIEVCEAAYEELQAKKVSPIGAYIQLGTESIKVLDALTHEIIENKVLKEVCFTSVIGSKGQILTYITQDDELKIYSCFLFQCGGERAAQIANTFGDAFKLLAEEQKKLGENPFAGVGERLTPPADLFSIQIHRSDLIPAKIIGAGAFGQVYLADQKIEGGLVRRAVKMLRGAASDADRKIFIRETQFMRHLNHENLVQLVGVAMQQKPWLMVLDYCQFGDLRGVLQGCKSRKIVLNFAEVLNLAMQVAAGMQYMAERRYIHMDLAARNCLVAKGTLVKVADFGLSRSLPKGQSVWKSDTVMRLPIKWTAIESLDDRMFSEASDVWAYGILLWEITAYGGVPYEDLKPQEVQRKVREGLRLTKVPGVSDEFHKLCQTCWFHNREERPTFVELQKQLIRMLTRVCFPDTFADCIMTDLETETNGSKIRDLSAELSAPSGK